MADEHEKSVVDTLHEFFERKQIPDRSCPICDVDDWGVYKAGTSDLSLIRVPQDRPMRNPPPALRLYVMVCHNCGYVRQHARRYVDGDSE